MDDSLHHGYLVLGTLALIAAVMRALQLAPLPRVELGRRGEQRRVALQSAFRHLEPGARWLGARCAQLPITRLRERLDTQLLRSGSFLGLCANELLGLCILGAVVGVALALALADRSVALWVTVAGLLGTGLPLLVLRDHKRGRDRMIARQLPAALDLFALSLNAGFDFAGSLALVESSLIAPRDPLRDELRLVMQELAMGNSRERALRSLAERTEVAELLEVIRVVIQAERKGTPLAEVLDMQAQIARNRRSVLAEEAAARAAIMLLAPMMLILLALLLLLLGPLAIRSLP
jgi:tight adherence protein C